MIAEVIDGGTLDFNVQASNLQGDLRADAASQMHVALSNNASITGAMTNVASVALDAATWNMTGNSTVGRLDLGSGTVSLGNGTTFNTLNVAGNFSGNDGTILFNTVLAGDTAASDKLIIGGDTSGSANVRVNNVGGAGAQTDKGIELIQVGGASNGQFTLAGRAVGGQYDYFLFKGTGTDGNWYLRSQLPTQPDPCVADPTLPECNPVLPGPDPDPVLRPEPGAYLANLQAAQTMFRLGYHDRQAGQNGGRAWARVDGSRNGFDAVSRQLDIRGNSQALTVGADVWRHDSGSSVGVMLSSGNATSTSTNALTGYYARGKVKGEALGLYGTWRGGNGADPYAGFYVDGSVQRAQFRNRVEGIGLADERYDSRAWQGAVETGYAFRVGGASNGGIYLEPQLQLGYNRWDSNRHTEANGTVVTSEDADGLFGRAGLRLSGVTRWGNGTTEVQPYIAAHWLHTRAESQIRMDDEIVDARIPRSRGEFSAGASLKFGNGVGAWGGLSLQKASGFHQTSAQVGVSYSW
ncbi:autotransporter outer membrane beta-barrel domain-containing protein [Stenotrophomonas lactitubi]|uniref:autotransporter family protein n=1 Tax=Stenotrophomonas lactitubi TaxID=2045214 RepID=UPI0035C187D9